MNLNQYKTHEPGNLVQVRGREWVVLPSGDSDLILLKPLGGSDEEITAIFTPFNFDDDALQDYEIQFPSANDLGDFLSSRLLFNATRLAFRSGAGPFRSFGKLSFRPRAYQIVPLIMALKQDPIRLLIADDVGIGKTIEAAMIIRELMDRGELANGFAVVCLPHLCEQWQEELKDKFNIDAVIIRSGTISSLEKHLVGDESIYIHYPFQVISIDYVKTENNREKFMHECPKLIIVDEAHTCASDIDAKSPNQQRYKLLKELVTRHADLNLVMLSATPHSGKQFQFQSLLGLLKPEFANLNMDDGDDKSFVNQLSDYYIQRKRIDITKYITETTDFPDRDPKEVSYELHPEYKSLFARLVAFTREYVSKKNEPEHRKRFRYWAALGLLRGVMSSPSAGAAMLRSRASKLDEKQAQAVFSDEENESDNPVMDNDFGKERDELPKEVMDKNIFTDSEVHKLKAFADELEGLGNATKDKKAASALKVAEDWLAKDRSTVIFCRYIETARYLGEIMKDKLSSKFKGLEVAVVTGLMNDDERRMAIEALGKGAKQRLLICTDCLSEGINLQQYFNSLLHYDLPWNPNRLEQREGRIDRFGQEEKTVHCWLLVGKDNPMDGVVLRVLLRKAEEIRKATGISVPFPEDSKSINEALLNAVLFSPDTVISGGAYQLSMFEEQMVAERELKVKNLYEQEKKRLEKIRNLFAQHNIIKKLDIEENLHQTDEILGNPEAVRSFVLQSIPQLKGSVQLLKKGYRLVSTNMPAVIRAIFDNDHEVLLSFDSPTPKGYHYIGRNHSLVEQLCNIIMAGAFGQQPNVRIARSSIFYTDAVKVKTVLVQLRIRNVIKSAGTGKEIVAEETLLWGYRNNLADGNFLPEDDAKKLLWDTIPKNEVTPKQQEYFLQSVKDEIDNAKGLIDNLVNERSTDLVKQHERFRKALGSDKFEVGTIVPPDKMAVYILFPDNRIVNT